MAPIFQKKWTVSGQHYSTPRGINNSYINDTPWISDWGYDALYLIVDFIAKKYGSLRPLFVFRISVRQSDSELSGLRYDMKFIEAKNNSSYWILFTILLYIQNLGKIQIPVVKREITLFLKSLRIVWNSREFNFHELEIISNKAKMDARGKNPWYTVYWY